METFSSEEIVSHYINDSNLTHAYLEDIYNYLVQRKYFKIVRQLLEEKLPRLHDVVLSPPTSMSETLLQMIQHPLKLLTTNRSIAKQNDPSPTIISTDCVNLVISSFVEEILVPAYSPPIQLFIVPCLANNINFPFFYLQQYFGEIVTRSNRLHSDQLSGEEQQRNANDNIMKLAQCFNSSFLFNSFMQFDQLHLEQLTNNVQYVRDYIRVLAKMSNNIRKLPRRSAVTIFRQNDDEMMDDDDDDADSDSDSNDNRRATGFGGGGRKREPITIEERECLLEVINMLNDQRRAQLIVDNIDAFLDDSEILSSLCKICHNLMLYHRLAIFEYK